MFRENVGTNPSSSVAARPAGALFSLVPTPSGLPLWAPHLPLPTPPLWAASAKGTLAHAVQAEACEVLRVGLDLLRGCRPWSHNVLLLAACWPRDNDHLESLTEITPFNSYHYPKRGSY